MQPRALKDQLYAAWADIGKAVASPKRIELLDLLAQGERTVEALARETGLTINNTSSHLNVLKEARLVGTRKEAQFVYHHLADDGVVAVLRTIQTLARRRLHEVDHLARTFLDARDPIEPIDAKELQRRLRLGDVTLIDVRPSLEYDAGHIPGAVSVPIEQLKDRLRDLPKRREVVAYCRGPYCVFAIEAVEHLRHQGFVARRLADGLPDWRIAGRPINQTARAANSSSPAATSRRSATQTRRSAR